MGRRSPRLPAPEQGSHVSGLQLVEDESSSVPIEPLMIVFPWDGTSSFLIAQETQRPLAAIQHATVHTNNTEYPIPKDLRHNPAAL